MVGRWTQSEFSLNTQLVAALWRAKEDGAVHGRSTQMKFGITTLKISVLSTNVPS